MWKAWFAEACASVAVSSCHISLFMPTHKQSILVDLLTVLGSEIEANLLSRSFPKVRGSWFLTSLFLSPVGEVIDQGIFAALNHADMWLRCWGKKKLFLCFHWRWQDFVIYCYAGMLQQGSRTLVKVLLTVTVFKCYVLSSCWHHCFFSFLWTLVTISHPSVYSEKSSLL